jgi:drug/metabolite transporter (DMT)-like permease
VSGYGLDDWVIKVRFPAEARDFSSNPCPDQLWGPPSLLYNAYQGVLSLGLKHSWGVMLTTQPHLVSRKSRSYTSSPLSVFVACCGTALAFYIIFKMILLKKADQRQSPVN